MNKRLLLSILSILIISYYSTSFAQEDYKNLHKKTEYDQAQSYFVPHLEKSDYKFKKRPKNIILLIGDGMGVGQIFSGFTANKGHLNIFNMNVVGFSQTQSLSDYVTDSAAGGTAIACGEKTKNGYLGLDAKNDTLFSILHYAQKAKKLTGLISTSAITHATPASFVAHVPKRTAYQEIALDFLKSGVDIMIGGGETQFTDRTDERNLLEEFRLKGYTIEDNIDKAIKAPSLPLAVFTATNHDSCYHSRGDVLPKATQLSLNLLSKSKNGFFIMIEGSQIDWGGHQNNIGFIIEEMLDFDRAVGKAIEFARKDKNTLVIVTADHETGGTAILDGDIQLGSVTAGFETTHHTGIMVPVFAYGCGAQNFAGVYDNTQIFYKMMDLLKLKK